MSDSTGTSTVTVTRVEVIDAIETAFKKAPLTKEDLVAAAEHAGVRQPIIELLERLPRRIRVIHGIHGHSWHSWHFRAILA